jgi:hypothetical protein
MPQPAQPVAIANAGLVLLAPFLPDLFAQLGLVSADAAAAGRPLAAEATCRAVQGLSYLAEGRWEGAATEPVIERVLCGAPAEDAPAPVGAPDPRDLVTCDDLLRAVISDWTALDDTSIKGLRETFLQRRGVLLRTDVGWALTVQSRAYDLLLDKVPWTFSLISLPWMTEPLRVTWPGA